MRKGKGEMTYKQLLDENNGANFCPNCGDDMRLHQNILCDQAEAELTR